MLVHVDGEGRRHSLAGKTTRALDHANSSTMLLLSHKSALFVVIAVLFVLATTLIAVAQSDRCPARGRPSVEIPFTLIGDHIYAMASINGTGPYRFIVDTGGVNLVDARLANHLSLHITGRESGHGTGPETVESGKTTIGHLTLGRITFTKQSFYTFDFRQLYAGGGVKMMGMIGATLFRRYVTCIDFHHKVIDLIEPGKFDKSRAGSSVAMSIKGSEITLHGSFDGIPGIFQVDTGSPSTLTLATAFVTKHQLLRRFPRHIETSSGGVGGSAREYTVRGSDLALGAEKISRPVTALAAVTKGKLAGSELSGIVGVGALKRYVVTLDFPGEHLFLKRYEPAPPDLDTYDRSGMRIEADPEGFRVTVVSQGTPAGQAGLHPGDLIVAIDGRPATSITLPALRDELRERPAGSVITLGIKTEGRGRSVHIVLRDLL